MFDKISEGTKLLAKQIIDKPHDWVQGQYHFINKQHKDIMIWTSNGEDFIQLEGNKCFNKAERKLIADAIKKSIALKITF